MVSYKHQNRVILKIFKELTTIGFKIDMGRKGGYRIVPPSSMGGSIYFTHGTSACEHPIRRYLRDTYGIIVHADHSVELVHKKD